MYVDCCVVPVPVANADAYRVHAEAFGKIIIELGALTYIEAIADDVKDGQWTDFYRAVERKPEETVYVAWITFSSRERRDEIWAAFMSDPRAAMMKDMPFDGKRMIFGGFKPILEMKA